MKLDDKDIEKIFNDGFDGFEPVTEENDWREMAKLLEEEDRGIIVFFRRLKNKFNRKLLIIMTLIPLITAVYLSLGVGSETKQISDVSITSKQETTIADGLNMKGNDRREKSNEMILTESEVTLEKNRVTKPKSEETGKSATKPALQLDHKLPTVENTESSVMSMVKSKIPNQNEPIPKPS